MSKIRILTGGGSTIDFIDDISQLESEPKSNNAYYIFKKNISTIVQWMEKNNIEIITNKISKQLIDKKLLIRNTIIF